MRKIFLLLGIMATIGMGILPLGTAAQTPTCGVTAISLDANPAQVEKNTDPIKFTYVVTTDCTDRSQIKFIMRSSDNDFQKDFSTAYTETVSSSLFKKVTNTNLYTATRSFSYALFEFRPDPKTIRPCGQFKGEAIDCNANADVKVSVKQSNPGTGTGTGGTVTANQNYDQIIGNFQNPLKANSIPELLVRLMRILLGLIAAVAVVVIIVAGFRMVLAQGNPVALGKAKAAITWAIVGLIVALMAFSIVAILQRLIETK